MHNRTSLALFLCSLFAAFSLQGEPLSLEDVARIGKKSTDAMHHCLGTAMRKHKKEGVVAAAQFCIDSAQALSDEINSGLEKGVTLRRISRKNRNPANRAGADEAPILEALELLAASNAYLPEYIVQVNEKGDYKFYRPIMLSKSGCLACHGDPEGMKEELRNLFRSHYPNDKALDYERGDLRGAFVVEIRQGEFLQIGNQNQTKDQQ
jgi:hypothetical protein